MRWTPLSSSSEAASQFEVSVVTWIDRMELWIILEKVVLCLCRHLPRRAIYCLRTASREATAAVTAQYPENSPGAESSSPSRVQTMLEMPFFFLIKKYHSDLPLPQHRFPTGWVVSIQLKHMFNNENILHQLFKQNSFWICWCGSWLGADEPGACLRDRGTFAKLLWPPGSDTGLVTATHFSPPYWHRAKHSTGEFPQSHVAHAAGNN